MFSKLILHNLKLNDLLQLDPYGDDMYADIYIDDLATLSGDAELLTELQNLSDAELNAINLWVESSMDGYDLNLDDYLDVVYPPDIDASEGVVTEKSDSTNVFFEVEVGNGETKKLTPPNYPTQSNKYPRNTKASSILPKKPKWNSRFLGKKRDVILEEEPVQSFSIKDAVNWGLPAVSSLGQAFHAILKVLTGNEESENVIAERVDPLNANPDTHSQVFRLNDNVEEIDYHEMYRELQPGIEITAIRVQELYDSAMLWLNGRHLGFRSHADTDLDSWIQTSHELSQSAFFLALWMSFDAQLNADFRKRSSADQSYLDPLQHPIRLALGFRAGYEKHNLSGYLYSPQWTTDRGRRSDHTTKYNTNFFSHIFGLDASVEADISLYHTLGNQSLRDVLEGSNTRADYCKSEVEDTASSTQIFHDGHLCRIAMSYYWPVVQYVVDHFGQIETGVGKPEEIRLANGLEPLELYEGEDALLHEVNAAEADGGNADAQMWMVSKVI